MENLVTVPTQYGPINGYKKTSILGREYYNFQRIPYMKAPIGKLRFVDPQPPENWTEPLDCTKEGPPFCNVFFADQKYQGELSGVHINVFTNNIDPKVPYPVLVWIHGGGVLTGNATEEFNGPDYLMQKDVIVVTFQYRIGVFGFLSLEDPELKIPGNTQFRDHICALKWVQNNISNFGGDPSNVTLFGESWGGGSACYHLISEKSKGLFHRAILMSGTALNNVYTYFPRRDWALRLCQKMGYEGPEDEKSLLEFLENADEREIVMVSAQVMTDEEKNFDGYICAFGPTIEPYDNGNAFLTDDIIKMANTAWGNDIDIMIGNTSNEMVMLSLCVHMPAFFDTYKCFQRYVPREFELPVDSEKRLKYADVLQKSYYGDEEPAPDNVRGLMGVNNDCILWHPTYRIIMSRLKHGRGKSFAYRFDYVTNNNLMRAKYNIDEKLPEAAHGDDCGYLFRMKGMEYENFSLPINSPAFDGIKLMTSIITNFAKSGNPNVSELKDVKWIPCSLESPLFGLNINENESKMMEFPEYERFKVFNQIFEEENKILY